MTGVRLQFGIVRKAIRKTNVPPCSKFATLYPKKNSPINIKWNNITILFQMLFILQVYFTKHFSRVILAPLRKKGAVPGKEKTMQIRFVSSPRYEYKELESSLLCQDFSLACPDEMSTRLRVPTRMRRAMFFQTIRALCR